jgi:hypothetical protein
VVLPFNKEVLALKNETKNAPINAPIKSMKTQAAILEMLKGDNTLTREIMCVRLEKDIGQKKTPSPKQSSGTVPIGGTGASPDEHLLLKSRNGFIYLEICYYSFIKRLIKVP